MARWEMIRSGLRILGVGLEKRPATELEIQIKELEAHVRMLEDDLVKKRTALRICQKEGNRLRFEHTEVELLVKALALYKGGEYEFHGTVQAAEKTSLYKTYEASNFYTPREEEKG